MRYFTYIKCQASQVHIRLPFLNQVFTRHTGLKWHKKSFKIPISSVSFVDIVLFFSNQQ